MRMDIIMVLFCTFGCILNDLLSFVCGREVLKDFLRGAIGKNKAKHIWSSMSFLDKLSLKKIKIICADDSDLFMKYYILYKVFIFSLLPKYLLLLLTVLWANTFGKVVTLIIGITVLLLSVGVCLVFRIPQLPDGTTKFIHYRRKRRK